MYTPVANARVWEGTLRLLEKQQAGEQIQP